MCVFFLLLLVRFIICAIRKFSTISHGVCVFSLSSYTHTRFTPRLQFRGFRLLLLAAGAYTLFFFYCEQFSAHIFSIEHIFALKVFLTTEVARTNFGTPATSVSNAIRNENKNGFQNRKNTQRKII